MVIGDVEGRNEGPPGGKVRWLTVAAVLCFVYGVAFTLNIHPIGDGLWFWYGRLFREHHLLYSGMHLPLQPLFVLLTAWTQSLFGIGWLASKMLAFAQMLMFCVGLWMLARRVPWSDGERALLLGAAFAMTLTASIFRFDDYHATNCCFEAFSLVLLLRIGERGSSAASGWMSLALGALSGLALSNRLNDGALLFAGCGFVLWFAARRFRWSALGLFCGGMLASFTGIILLTGDSLRAWMSNSVVGASAIKGGTFSVLKGPLSFIKWQIKFNLSDRHTVLHAMLVALLLTFVVQLWTAWKMGTTVARWKQWTAAAGLVVVVVLSFRQSGVNWPNLAIGSYAMLVILGMAGWMLWRVVGRWRRGEESGPWWRETLLIMPLMRVVASGTTSRSSNEGIFETLGFFLLLLPLCVPSFFAVRHRKLAFEMLACVVLCSGLVAKAYQPYLWHYFSDRTMFVDRVWYRHPLYGPMYVERDQLQIIQDTCSTMNREGHPTGMLEVTNPYANWFCDVPPWHDYVQTWYDTVSRSTMETLIAELKSDPPQWIVYQWAPETLQMHEILYNHEKPLPHRDLNRLIRERVAAGQWTIAYQRRFQRTDWMVIRTAPAVVAPLK